MVSDCILIDGSMIEGGGQILRASLSLSMAMGKPFRMKNIRAKRPKPGLKRQHLTCIKAARAICGATVSGAEVNATEISFTPGPVKSGEYRFDVGGGGSVTLVLQSIVPPLLKASSPSRITVTGGTHVPFAPTFEFMQQTLFPWLEKLGSRVSAEIHRLGFMQVGGGSVSVDIFPRELKPLKEESVHNRGNVETVIYSLNLPEDISLRQSKILLSERASGLGITEGPIFIDYCNSGENLPEGAGNAVVLTMQHNGNRTVFSEIGWRGRGAEGVAREAAKRASAFRTSNVPVERHLADQLLVPMLLAGGGTFVTERMTPHTRTLLELLPLFSKMNICVTKESGKTVRITMH